MHVITRWICLMAAIAAVLPAAGCRKRKADPALAAIVHAEPIFRVASALTPADQLKLLTDAMTTWEDQNSGRALTNLSQLVESRVIDQLPVPPPGRRFVIDGQRHQVVLGAP